MASLRGIEGHRFLSDDVSICEADVPAIHGHRQVTDVHLLTLARRHGIPLVTFDGGIEAVAGTNGIELLHGLG